jgi:hypothetical protein
MTNRMTHTNRMTISSIDFKKPLIIFGLFWLLIASCFTIIMAIVIPNIFLKAIFVLLCLAVLVIIVDIITSRISIEKGIITKKSLFRSRSIKFIEIKRIGVYVQEPRSATYIERKDYDNKYWYGQKLIYISKRQDYDPIFSISQRETIKFQYKKEIFAEIEKRI